MKVDASLVPLSIYVHWPWCVQKCPYCDFNSHAQREDLVTLYADALLMDWERQLPDLLGREVHSVFFGGGTPSLAPPQVIAGLIERFDKDLGLSSECEITLEANPGTADQSNFRGYLNAGVNRLSLGIQSFDTAMLKVLGRIHDDRQSREAIELARSVGFSRLNLDLMTGLPGQTAAMAVADMEMALNFSPEHVSCYQLTLEPNTPFFSRPPSTMPSEDEADALLTLSHECLLSQGFERYEVSAWRSAQGKPSQHNLNYWSFGDYVGLGAGAHGKLTDDVGNLWRRQQVLVPAHYIEQMKRQALPAQQLIEPENRAFEFLMNGLRLTSGVPTRFLSRAGLQMEDLEPAWSKGVVSGLLLPMGDRLCTTPRGYRYLNQTLGYWI